jgi:uncharacterized protein YifN (PemK superfamily)
MTTFTIKYLNLDDSNNLLGTEVSTNIEICELPHDPSKDNIYIRKVFSGSDYSFWKVEKIDPIDDTVAKTVDVEIALSPVKHLPKSVAERHSNNGSRLLRGRLLECDFGYFSQDYTSGKGLAVTLSNYNGKLPFEMVKRRLVVVISNKEDPALVVPISKGDKAKDKRTVVPITSFPTDLVMFTNPRCYAKAGAVSYVSGHRLFPLRFMDDQGKRQTDDRIEKKLSNEDVVNIKKAVFTAVGGDNLLKDVHSLETEIDNLKTEISSKINELEVKDREIEGLMEILDERTK